MASIPRPFMKSFAGWEAASAHIELEDTMDAQASFEALFQGYNVEDYNGAEFDDWAYLVREIKNPDDYCATSVWVNGHWVGRLKRHDAANYVVEMNGLARQEMNLVVPAHLWAQRTPNRLVSRVTLRMPAPGSVAPVNKFPKKGFTVLPPGPEVPITGFEHNINLLKPYISTGREVSLALVLTATRKGGIDVTLDGKTIGVLSPVQVAKVMPLVKAAANAKLLAVARGVVAGSDVMTDMWMILGGVDEVGQYWKPTKDGGK